MPARLKSPLEGVTRSMYDPTYAIWCQMKQRCLNPNNKGYKRYGAKGITVHSQFMTFEGFAEYVGPRPEVNMSLDRLDGDGPYAPGNVRWATPKQQGSFIQRSRAAEFAWPFIRSDLK